MWRRAYFLLIFVRLYFALSPSYLHPDEHFQGPEVIAGRIFHHAVHETWEFQSSAPIRSIFPLWPVYGLPMLLLKSVWGGWNSQEVPPGVIFNTLRLVMFCLSFVLEDWALQELVPERGRKRTALLLVASSYVTWTWQVHTFSNAVETVTVLWSLVLIQRITEIAKARRSSFLATVVLSFLLVFGTFNRITFPTFVTIPLLSLIPTVYKRPSILLTMIFISTFVTLLAVSTDTIFYNPPLASVRQMLRNPIITPLNNIRYNTQASNLALHGTHPFFQHSLVNLPQLLGPAFLLMVIGAVRLEIPLMSGIFGTIVLSCFPHQEARFLLPAVPLILSSLELPRKFTRSWLSSWIVFNMLLGCLMGVFHQGGVVPVQIHLASLTDVTHAFWWKTYSPPEWVLGQQSDRMLTIDLMGLSKDLLEERLCVDANGRGDTVLVAPASATYLDHFVIAENATSLTLEEAWKYPKHLNLDDLDFGDDGFLPTFQRVIGRRGLIIWRVECRET